MSPEKTSLIHRYSEGWVKHLRKERTANNKKRDNLTPEQKQKKMTAASWAAVLGLMNLETQDNHQLRYLYNEAILENETIRNIVRERYQSAYDDATQGDGNGRRNRDEFQQKYTIDKTSPFYDPKLITRLNPLIQVIDRSLFRNPQVKK